MKYIAIFGAAVIALGVAAMVMLTGGEPPSVPAKPSPTPKATPSPSASKPPSPSPSPSVSRPAPPTPEAVVASTRELVDAFTAIQADADTHPGAAPAPDQAAKVRELQKKTHEIAGKLVTDLRRQSAAWTQVIDVLLTVPDVRVALKVGERVKMAADTTAEARCVGLLKPDQPLNSRRIAAALLAGRPSPPGIDALSAAAESDSEAVVRLAAVTALGELLRRPGNKESAEKIRELLKRRSEVETDPATKETAARLANPPKLPERPPLPTSTPTPAPPQPSPSKTP